MADPGRYLSQMKLPRPDLLPCPGCRGHRRPPSLEVCGRCWKELRADTREAMQLKDPRAEDRRASFRRQIQSGLPLGAIRVTP